MIMLQRANSSMGFFTNVGVKWTQRQFGLNQRLNEGDLRFFNHL